MVVSEKIEEHLLFSESGVKNFRIRKNPPKKRIDVSV
jgi:hypothetical protein